MRTEFEKAYYVAAPQNPWRSGGKVAKPDVFFEEIFGICSEYQAMMCAYKANRAIIKMMKGIYDCKT